MSVEQLECSRAPETQQQYDERFEEIVDVYHELDQAIDLQADYVDHLKLKLASLIETLLDNPAASMRGEFEWLERLYEKRTVISHDQLGTDYREFVTRDPATHGIDHHFRKIDFPNGTRWLCDRTMFHGELIMPMNFILKGDELIVTQERHNRSAIVLEGEARRYALSRFFFDTLRAADLMLTRSSEEVERSNAAALELLRS